MPRSARLGQLEAAGVRIASVVWPMRLPWGALWLGVSLLLRPVAPVRVGTVRSAGAVLVLAGRATLVLLGR